MRSISKWLQSLGLEQYAQAFADNDIDLEIATSLSDQDLKELGVSSMGHRKKLLKAIAQLDQTPADPPASVAQPLATDNAEHRQLTVMFCDLVGSTQLSQKLDPEALRELMQAYQKSCGQVIEKYDGHVAQYLGDGLMVYFGWPQAHEDDPERAIRAALEIVEAIKQVQAPEPLGVRVGIATGPVVVGATGDGDASVPKLAVGETPNVAARIQGLAKADEILIGSATRRLVGGFFDLADSGVHALKGIVEPVRTWKITGLAKAEGRFDAAHGQAELTPLVGREEELGILIRRWQLAQDGEGQVVLLCGEPGIGKSRILRALRERLETEGVRAMRFQCSPYYINSAFWPTIDNFERALKFERDESAESKLDKLESLIVGHYGRPQSDVRFIAAMLSIPCDERYGEVAMTPQKFKDESLRTLVDLTEAAASKQPSVMLFEDLHWSDPTTLDVLDLMIDRVKTIPLLIVLAHRPEFHNRWSDHGHVISLNLSKLTRAQSAALVSRVAGGKALPENLLVQILTKTDGVPLFVEELTKSILESGELTEAGDHYEYAGTSRSVTIPATLRDSLMARLDRLTPVKEIAHIGAAIGRKFSYELVSAVAPLSSKQLDVALAYLTDSGLAFRRGTPPDAVYTFKHALVQDAAYDSLLKSKRQELHAKIAKVIEERFPEIKETEPEVLAHHYTEAGLAQQASVYWLSAGRASYGRFALTEAMRQLGFGIDQIKMLATGETRDRIELDTQLCLGNTFIQAKGLASPEADVAFKRALKLSGVHSRPNELAPILWGIFVVRLIAGQPRVAVEIAKELLSKTQGEREAELVARTALMDAHFWMGDFEVAQGYYEEALDLYDEGSDVNLIASYAFDMKTTNLIYASHFQWMLGYPDRARRTKELLDAWANHLDNPFMSAFAYTWGAGVFHYCGELDKHRLQVERGQELSLQIGFPHFEGQAHLWRAWNRAKTGDLSAENIARFESSIAQYAGVGSSILVPYFRALRADALSERGEIPAALSLIKGAVELDDAFGEASHAAEIHRIHADILLRGGAVNSSLAEQAYRSSLDIARQQQARGWELRTSTSLARLWQSQGKKREAHDLLAPVYDWFTEGFDTKDLKEAKALLEELAQ